MQKEIVIKVKNDSDRQEKLNRQLKEFDIENEIEEFFEYKTGIDPATLMRKHKKRKHGKPVTTDSLVKRHFKRLDGEVLELNKEIEEAAREVEILNNTK